MKIKLFQSDREPYFWTIKELDEIEKYDKHLYSTVDRYNFEFKGLKFEVDKTSDPNLFEFIEDGLNVIVTSNRFTFFDRFEKVFGKKYKFLIVAKTIEDYWLTLAQDQDKLLDYVSNSDNIKIIWDIYIHKVKNFFFEPKVHIQNYYNSDFAFPSTLFLYGNEMYKNSSYKKRIGFHVNKQVFDVRTKLSNRLLNIENRNLYLTINKTYHNTNFNQTTNYISPIFDCESRNHGIKYGDYIDSFINLNIKSDIELVYETFTTKSPHVQFIKWNEKTIKHLFLGKPFLHIDPVAHNLIKINGFEPYTPLFTNELLSVYETYDINKLIVHKDEFWLDKLYDNIIWLLNMNDTEWNKRIDLCYEIADRNRKKIFELIFNTSLFPYIENYDNI